MDNTQEYINLKRSHADLQRHVWALNKETQKLRGIVAWLYAAVATIYGAAVLSVVASLIF